MLDGGFGQATEEIVIAALVAADAILDGSQVTGLCLVAELGVSQLRTGHDHQVRLALLQNKDQYLLYFL